jgi:nardilysin
MASVAADALIHGNIDNVDAMTVRDAILNCLAATVGTVLPSKKYPRELVNQIPSQIEPTTILCPSKNVNEANTAVEIYFQVGKDNVRERVILDMLSHLMSEPFYDQLRTKDQFGYSVGCDSRWTCGIMGIHFVVVSSTRSAVSFVLQSGVSTSNIVRH